MRALAGPSLLTVFLASIVFTNRAGAQASDSAWIYTMAFKTDSGSGGGHWETVLRQWISAKRVRMETVEAPAALAVTQGMYTVIDTQDSTMKMVMPSQQMVSVTVLPNMARTMQNFAPKIDVVYTKHTIDDLGPADSLLGHATHRYRISALGTVTASLNGQSCERHVDSETEVWMAPDVNLREARDQAASMLGVVPSAVTQWDSLAANLKGLALRTVSTSRRVDASGKPFVVTMRSEYTELSHLPTADSMFAVPSDYQVLDTRGMISADAIATASADGVASRLQIYCSTLGG